MVVARPLRAAAALWPLLLLPHLLLLQLAPNVGADAHIGGAPPTSTSTTPTPTPASPPDASPSPSTDPAATGTPTAVSSWSGPLTRHARLATRDIQRFRSYKDVSILPFHVPARVRFASFNFTVTETVMPGIVRKCPPRKVTVALKFGSYPVVNPDGARFPDYYETRRLPYYEFEFESDTKPRTLNVSNPLPGDWYAVAFLSYTDPNDDKIVQQGLSASCVALLEAALDISPPADVPQVMEGVPAPVRVEGTEADELRRDFRIYVPATARVATVELIASSCSRSRCPGVELTARCKAFPEADGKKDTARRNCPGENIQRGDECALGVEPEEDTWMYIAVQVKPDVKTAGKETQIAYALNVTFELEQTSGVDGECSVADGECWSRVTLTRQSYVALFMYNYVRVLDPATPPGNAQAQAVNVSTSAPTVLAFPVFPVKDVGGTLTFELRLDRTMTLMNATMDFRKLFASGAAGGASDGGGEEASSTTSPAPTAAAGGIVNVSVVACLTYSSKRVPAFPDACVDPTTGDHSPASIRVNTTSSTTYTGKLHVPYPEPGRWYLSVRPFCYLSADDKPSPVDCGDLNETQISFVLDSEMCGAESCGQWGVCNTYLSGGVIFSTCVCKHGYRGWGCTDDQRIDQLKDLLLAALLLTLSNLPFLPAAIVAARRGYYTEGFVYCCTLFFSTFYHACEAGEDVYSYCLMRLDVLQFCDFYSAILALWVTMIAMADLPPTPRSLLHMAGAVGIALGTEYDRTSLAVFMIPTVVGVALVGTRWGMRCRAQRSCYPHKNYWKYCVPPGAVLVLVGLVCFSFLQTRSNYKYVHSAWHSMMALAIICVLPSRRHSAFESVESDDSVDSTAPFWKRFWKQTTRWLCAVPRCRIRRRASVCSTAPNEVVGEYQRWN